MDGEKDMRSSWGSGTGEGNGLEHSTFVPEGRSIIALASVYQLKIVENASH